MYLPHDRYNTLVGFAEGCNLATGGVLLSGFNEWFSEAVLGCQTSLHWSAVVASKFVPGVWGRGRSR